MFVKLQSSRGYMYSISQAIDKTQRVSNADCSAVLLYASTSAVAVANEAVQCLGGNGFTNDYGVARIYRDAKLYDIGAGTNEIRRWVIGREMMKHNTWIIIMESMMFLNVSVCFWFSQRLFRFERLKLCVFVCYVLKLSSYLTIKVCDITICNAC